MKSVSAVAFASLLASASAFAPVQKVCLFFEAERNGFCEVLVFSRNLTALLVVVDHGMFRLASLRLEL